MSAAVALGRQSQAERVLGTASDRDGNKVLVTVQGDGVVCYSTSRLGQKDTKALGSSQAQLLAPVQPLDSTYIAAVQPHGSSHGLLVCTSATSRQPKPLLDAEQQLPLPSTLHAVHVIHGSGRHGSSCAAVVLADGTVGTADFAALCIRMCPGNIPNSRIAARQGAANAAALASAVNSTGQLLAVVHQAAAGADVLVDVYAAADASAAAASGASQLQLTHTCTVASPSSSSRISHVSLAWGVLALVWKDNSVTTYHSNLASKSNDAGHTASIPLPPAIAAAVASQLQPNRKRRAADDGALPSKVLCAAVSDTQLLLMAVQSPAEATYAVVDSRYGCCLSSGKLSLGSAAADAAGASSSCELLPLPPQSSAQAVLRVGGSVYLLHLQLPKADLAGLVSKLAVSSDHTNVGTSSTLLTGRQQINLAALAAAVAVPQQICVLQQIPAAAVQQAEAASGDTVSAAAAQLAAIIGQPAAELHQAAQQLVAALQQQANPGGQRKQTKAGGRRAQQQVDSEGQQHLPAGAAAVLVSQRLLAQGLGALAEAGDWAMLQQLHQLQPLQSLSLCAELLPALAAADQHALIRQVLSYAQEIPADSLVRAVGHLLQQAGDKAARQAEGAAMRQVAAASVDAAETAVAAGIEVAAGPLLGMACRAAAAVDGFTASEVLLHALLAAPLDAVEAQAALKQLSTPVVLRLLRYLDKWVQKYTCLPLREAPAVSSWAGVGLQGSPWDSEHAGAILAVPSWGQVLDWARLALDAHLTRLAMLPAAAALLQRMRQALQQEVGGSSKLIALKGIADHMAMGAPLPLVAEAANSAYTLELLDLRVAGKT